MGKKVVIAGHICVDMTPAIPGEKVSSLHEIIAPGKLITAGDITISTGGAVANTGLAMKILGADATLMGKIGKDEFGEMVCRVLRQYGCEDSMIVSCSTIRGPMIFSARRIWIWTGSGRLPCFISGIRRL